MLYIPRQSEKLGEKYVLTFFLDIHNNNGVQQNNISIDERYYSLGDCNRYIPLGFFYWKIYFIIKKYTRSFNCSDT